MAPLPVTLAPVTTAKTPATPAFTIGRVTLPGRCNTHQTKQRRREPKMHRTSKPKGRKAKKYAYFEPAVTYEEEKRLKRNLPQAINLSEYIGIY